MGFFKRKEKSVQPPTGKTEWIVCGLGNIGSKYEDTRHNVGFLALDYLYQKLNISAEKKKYKALIREGILCGKRVLFLKPTTFMNLSGEAVREAADFYKIPREKVIIIFDDTTLPAGSLRIRKKGSDGGHNGIKSIIAHLKGDDFPRIKIGIGGKPNLDYDLADWVLSKIGKEDKMLLDTQFEKNLDILELIISGSIEQAMNKYN